MKILVVIPAYNEESVIYDVVKKVKENGYEVVVVDDGSTDKTCQTAESAGVKVLRHPVNCGQGAALQTGFEYAKKTDADITVTFDGDGQNEPLEIKKIIIPIATGQAEVVLGSRYLGIESNVPFIKKYIIHKGARLFERAFVGIRLSDSHNGFRAFSKKALKQIKISQNQMAHATEIVEQIKKNKLKFVECPVTMRYTGYSKKKGQSLWNSFKIIFDLLLSRVIKE